MKRTMPWHRRLRGLAVAHWHGELPADTSLWLRYLLPAAAGALVLAALTAYLSVDGTRLRLGGALFVSLWPTLLALDTWGAVGAWRAAQVRRRMGRRGALPMAALAVVALGAAATLTMGVVQHAPQAWRALQFVAGHDPAGHARVAPSAPGRPLRLSGHLGVGDADRLSAALAAVPAPARVLELDSAGGRLGEARRLARALQGQGWTLRVVGACRNACPLLLREGQRRQLAPGAELGFNRAGTEHVSPLVRWLARRRLVAALADAGLEPIFVLKALSMPPPQTWRPGADELLRGRFVSRAERPLDLELPPPASATADDYADALRVHALWQSIERRFPGTLATALQLLLDAHDAGADDDGLQAAAQSALEPLIGPLLYNAEVDLREPFARLLLDQMAAAADPALCARVLAGDAAARRTLPLAQAERFADWLRDALIEPTRTAPQRRASGAEHEVIRRTLGGHAPAALARVRLPSPQDPRACERATQLLESALALPQAERKLALRLAFELPP